MKQILRRRPAAIGGAVLACVPLVWAILWVLPRPHRPVDYLVAGTAGTVVWLGLVLAIVLRDSSQAVRTVGRSQRDDQRG